MDGAANEGTPRGTGCRGRLLRCGCLGSVGTFLLLLGLLCLAGGRPDLLWRPGLTAAVAAFGLPVSWDAVTSQVIDRVHVTGFRYQDPAVGTLEIPRLTIWLSWPPDVLLRGAPPVRLVHLDGAGRFTPSHGTSSDAGGGISPFLPLKELVVIEPGITVETTPPVTLRSARFAPDPSGAIRATARVDGPDGVGADVTALLDPSLTAARASCVLARLPLSAVVALTGSTLPLTPTTGTVSADLDLTAAWTAGTWDVEAAGTASVEGAALTTAALAVDDLNATVLFDGRRAMVSLSHARLSPATGPAVTVTGRFGLAPDAVLLEGISITPEGWGPTTTAPLVVDGSVATDVTSASLACSLLNLPLSSLASLPGAPRGLRGLASGQVAVTVRRNADDTWALHPDGVIDVRDGALDDDLAGVREARARVRVRGSRLELSLERALILHRGLPRLEAVGSATLTSEALDLTGLRLQGGDGLTVTVSTLVDLADLLPRRLDLELVGLALGPRMAVAPRLGGLPLTGHLRASASLRRPSGASPEAASGWLTAAFSGRLGPDLPLDVDLDLRQDEGTAALTATATGLTTGCRGQCTLSLTTGAPSSARLTLTSLPLDILALAGVDELPSGWLDLDVQAQATAQATARATAPAVASLLSSSSPSSLLSSFFRSPPSLASVTLSALTLATDDGTRFRLERPGTLTWKRDLATTGAGTLEGSLAGDFRGRPLPLSFRPTSDGTSFVVATSLAPLDLRELWLLLYPDAPFTKPLGRVGGRMAVVPLAAAGPHVEGTLDLDGVGVEHWRKVGDVVRRLTAVLPPIVLSLHRDGRTLRLVEDGAAQPRLTVEADGSGALTVGARDLVLAWEEVAPVERRTTSRGRLALSGEARLRPPGRRVEGNLVLKGWTEAPRPDGTQRRLELDGALEGRPGGFTLWAGCSDPQALASARATVNVTGETLELTATSNELPLELVPGLPELACYYLTIGGRARTTVPGGLPSLGAIIGSEGLSGLVRLLRHDGEVCLTSFAVTPSTSAPPLVASWRPFTASAGPAGVRIEDLELVFAGHGLRINGSVSSDGLCDLTLATDGVPLSTLADLAGLPALALQGTLTADATLRGPLPLPDLEGRLALDKASLGFPPLEQRLNLPSLVVTSQGPTTTVSAPGLTWGGSPLALTGRIDPSTHPGDPPRVTIRLAGTGLAVSWGPSRIGGVTVEADLDVTAQPPRLRASLRARDGLVLLPDFGGDSGGDGGLTTYQDRLHRLLASTDTEATVSLPDRMRVRSNFLDGELTGRLELRSRPEPTMAGRVELVRGSVSLHRREFQVNSASLAISGPPRQPRATVALNASTTVEPYRIDLAVSGPLDEPLVKLSSAPPLPEEDLVNLLMTGLLPTSSEKGITGELTASARDYLLSSTLNGLLASGLGLTSMSLRTAEQRSYLRMEKYLGRRVMVTVDRDVSRSDSQDAVLRTNYSFEIGLDRSLFIQGRTEDQGPSAAEQGSYVGLLRKLRFW